MSFVAKVTAALGLDTTEFQKGLTKTTAQVGAAGEDINNKLKRAFGAGDVFKGLMQGLGIGSAQQIVDLIVSPFKDAAEKAQKLEAITARTRAIYDEINKSKRTDEQNLAANLKEQSRLQADIVAAKKESKVDAEKTAQAELGLAELAKEEVALRKNIASSEQKLFEERAKAQQEQAQAQYDFGATVRENNLARMSDEEKLAKMQSDRSEMATLASETDFDLKKQVEEIDQKIFELAKKIREEDEKDAKALREKVASKREAIAAAEAATNSAIEQQRDRAGLTLEEVAAGAPGSSQTRKAQARRVQRLERDARRQRAGGFGAESEISTSKALNLRRSMGELSESERDPMKGAADAIVKSEEHLEKIKDDLEIVKLGGGKSK